jgi:hypothetical protein
MNAASDMASGSFFGAGSFCMACFFIDIQASAHKR